jgi:guanylate kinase
MNKTEKLILVGKAGAGKNYLFDKLKIDLPLFGIKHTTRPRREKESDKVDYYFSTNEDYQILYNDNKFFTHQEFKIEDPLNNTKTKVCYGLTKREFEEKQLFIFTPGEIYKLSQEDRKKCFIVYLDVPQQIREARMNIRKDNYDSTKRRFLSDDIDFHEFRDYDLKLTDSDYDTNIILSLMM